MKTLRLSLKNLTRQKRRSATLAIAIAFGFFIVTFLDTFVSGIVSNLENQFTQIIGGTVLVQGLKKLPPEAGQKRSTLVHTMEDKNYIQKIVDESKIKYKYTNHYSNTSATMIFEGNKSNAVIYGRDLTEKNLLDSLQFVEGNVEDFSLPDTIIITEKTAEALNVHVNESIVLKTTTIYGQNAVGDFVVRGIFKGNSFLSTIMAYTNIEDLNKVIELPEGGYTTFTVYLDNKDDQYKLSLYIENAIREDGNPVTNRIEAATTNPNNIGKGLEKQLTPEDIQWDGVKYAIETIYDEIPFLSTVFFYVHAITFSILMVILLIVMIGISNTYKMVLYERIKEIGTMRALGTTRTDVKRIFKNEATLLGLIGAFAGMIFAFIIAFIVSSIPFHNETLSFFLYKNHFTFKISVLSILVQYILLIILTRVAVIRVAAKAAKMSPAEALSTVK